MMLFMLRINGNSYYGSMESLDGWEVKIGHFHILAAQPNFRRYIARNSAPKLKNMEAELNTLAKNYLLECTPVLETEDAYYNYKKLNQIFLIDEDKNTFKSDLEEVQSKPLKPTKYKGRIILALREKRPYEEKDSTCFDINVFFRPVHKPFLEALDSILFKK